LRKVLLAAIAQNRLSAALQIGGPFVVFGSLDGETLGELAAVPESVPAFLYQCD